MKFNNEKNEFNECSFLERVHDLLNISIIFLDILITFFDFVKYIKIQLFI
jgi:hypothetical protein